eukprot:UN07010
MGENVIFKQINVTIYVKNDVYFKNIRFDCEEADEWGSICVLENCTWMEHCKITGTKRPSRVKSRSNSRSNSRRMRRPRSTEAGRYHGIVMDEAGINKSIYLAHCEFENVDCAVRISALGTSATILGCKFTNCGSMANKKSTIFQTFPKKPRLLTPKLELLVMKWLMMKLGNGLEFLTFRTITIGLLNLWHMK